MFEPNRLNGFVVHTPLLLFLLRMREYKKDIVLNVRL